MKLTNHPIILVAEDDPDDTLMLKDAFQEINYESPKFLQNGKLLIDYVKSMLLENKLPELIMVDLNMPVQDGRSVIKELRSHPQTKDIPIVVLSTSKNADDIQSIYTLGANDFFTKPSSFADLVTITQSILSKWLQIDIDHE